MDDPTTLIVISGQVGSMSGIKDLTTDKPEPPRRHRFGMIALALWTIAIVFVPIDMAYASGKTLTGTRDLLTITTAGASLATVLWFVDSHLVSHLISWRVGIHYAYRSGWRDRGKNCRCGSSGEHTADVVLIEPMRHPDDRRAIPEMRHNGHRVN